MRQIDIDGWRRKEHFNLYKDWTYPHLSLTAYVDLTAYYPYVKQHDISVNVAIIYVLARTANEIPEFRQRIRGNDVVEHDEVHPSSTILTDDDLFSYCTFDYFKDFAIFGKKAVAQIRLVKENRTLKDEPGRDDLLFMTAIPWISFTNLMHPIDLKSVDSVPRIAWGKFFEDGESLKMPLSVQGHHGLMDGVHIGKYFEQVQDYLNQPGYLLG